MAIPDKKVKCANCKNRSSCFNELSKEDHKFIENHRVELKFKAGEVICKQGSFASHIMFIYKGMAKAYLETSDGSQVILNVMPSGNMIGLPSLFTNYVFQYSASAIEDSIVCSVDIKVFEEYTKSNGGFAGEIIKTLNECTIRNYDRFISLTHKQLNGRFADVLIFLAEKVYKKDKFTMSLSRRDLAEFTGMAPESLTRVIAKFKNEGIINVSGKIYEIVNKDLLSKISDIG